MKMIKNKVFNQIFSL